MFYTVCKLEEAESSKLISKHVKNYGIKTLSLGTRNATGSMLFEVRRTARASSTLRTLTEDFGRNDTAWWSESALKCDRAVSCGSSMLTSNVYTVLSPCEPHFQLNRLPCSLCALYHGMNCQTLITGNDSS